MCASCDSPVGWRSAPATATHIGGKAHKGSCPHNCLSVSILLVIFSPTYSTQPIGVPNTVMPRGCHTCGPKSLMLSGCVWDLFHTRVLPSCSWLNANDSSQCIGEDVVNETNAPWLTHHVHVIQESAQLFRLPRAAWTLTSKTPWIPMEKSRGIKGSPGNWTGSRMTTWQTARWHGLLPCWPIVATWRRGTHDRTRQCHPPSTRLLWDRNLWLHESCAPRNLHQLWWRVHIGKENTLPRTLSQTVWPTSFRPNAAELFPSPSHEPLHLACSKQSIWHAWALQTPRQALLLWPNCWGLPPISRKCLNRPEALWRARKWTRPGPGDEPRGAVLRLWNRSLRSNVTLISGS